MKTALVLIDIQNDYFPGGKMELSGADEALLKAKDILLSARNSGLTVVHIRHVSIRQGATFFLPDTNGSEIKDSVVPIGEEKIFIKNYPNSFRKTGLQEYLDSLGVRKIIFCGMMSHMCVDTTVRAAFDMGYECILVHDACATRDLNFGETVVLAGDVQAAFMSALHGTFARVLSAEELLTEQML